jgi:hypothetical protein
MGLEEHAEINILRQSVKSYLRSLALFCQSFLPRLYYLRRVTSKENGYAYRSLWAIAKVSLMEQ